MTQSSVRQAVPAVAIVDTRNMWGQALDIFGIGRRVGVQGVIDGLKPYGFEIQHVYAGIATVPSQSRPSEYHKKALEQNVKYAEAVEGHTSGSVLHGRLAERDGCLEEKLVDVLCAIRIAEEVLKIREVASSAKAIVVLSEDMDLIPAYNFAREYGVNIFAASNATVDTRTDSGWLLLTESPLESIFGDIPGRYKGRALRDFIARQIISGKSLELTFEIIGGGDGCVYLKHNSGIRARWMSAPHGKYKRGSKLDLSVIGIVPGIRGSDFPQLLVGPKGTSVTTSVVTCEADVLNWRSPGRLEVELASGEKRVIHAPLGCAFPGMKVLLAADLNGAPQAYKLIGATTPHPKIAEWPDARQPVLVRVLGSARRPGELVRAVMAGSGVEVTLQPPGVDVAQAGDTYAALPAKLTPVQGGRVHISTIAVSSKLP
jgi:hypothetical protein